MDKNRCLLECLDVFEVCYIRYESEFNNSNNESSVQCIKNQSTGNHKVCIQGICSIQNSFLFCRCQKGYSGEACEFYGTPSLS
ncbi:hypothetical protein HZS_6697 [Henneguya salminicola]|nr:hypothetical protein HZS_6697 [Henneguya salminicola]